MAATVRPAASYIIFQQSHPDKQKPCKVIRTPRQPHISSYILIYDAAALIAASGGIALALLKGIFLFPERLGFSGLIHIENETWWFLWQQTIAQKALFIFAAVVIFNRSLR